MSTTQKQLSLAAVSLKHQFPIRFLFVWLMLGTVSEGRTQTIISGGNISGTITPDGNPYIVTADCTIPAGTVLTIQPGVEVVIAKGVSVVANGQIIAKGSPSQRITFRGTNSDATNVWSQILLNYSSSGSQFTHCDFSESRTALSLHTYDNNFHSVKVFNCRFRNCLENCIYGYAVGLVHGGMGGSHAYEPTLELDVRNCIFESGGNGCVLVSDGQRFVSGMFALNAYSYVRPTILNSVFKNLSGNAFQCSVGNYPGYSPGIFRNNVVCNCRTGIVTLDPFDIRVLNNIFVGVTNAVTRSGSQNNNVSYNCFWANQANFTGYPAAYGAIVWHNRNGHDADAAYNIFQEPMFLSANDFHCATNSPCIDAGTPDWAFTDMCFENGISQRAYYPDLGAYGGPDAANWLDVVPMLPVLATMSMSNTVIRVHWGAIPRSEYQVQYLTNLVLMGTNNWLVFPTGTVLATEKPTSLIVVKDTPQETLFFRIRSLGRTPGN